MKSRWLLNATAYTLAGAAASMSVGAALGFLGAVLVPEQAVDASMLVALAVGVLALARTVGVATIRFPQPARQTRDIWVKGSSPTVAAVRWGLDIGLIYTTWFTFPGTWFVTALAVVGREPAFGAALFVAYWIGRALSVWLGPLLMRDARETPQLLMAVHDQYEGFERAHAVALVMGATVLAVSIGAGTGL